MPKLQTPVLYEDSLDGLNEARPLSIGDEVNNLIELAVVNAEPISKDKLVRGRLLRCDNNGVLLKSNHKGFTNVETKDLLTVFGVALYTITFSQEVSFVLWELVSTTSSDPPYWCSITPFLLFQELSLTGTSNIVFKGTVLEIWAEPLTGWGTVGKFHGFYN